MRWLILLAIALFLVGCTPEKAIESNITNVTPESVIKEQPEEVLQKSLDLNIRSQESGLRVILEKVYLKERYLYVDVYGEKLLDLEIPNSEKFHAYFYYGSGELQDLDVCKLENIDEKHWRASYCAPIIKMNDRIFNEKIYFVLSAAKRDLLTNNFIRDVDKQDWSYVIELNFRDTFIKK